MTPRSTLIVAVLCAIAVISWIAARDDDDRAADASAITTVESGYYVLDAVIFGSNELGEPRYEIHAAEARQSDREGPIQMRDIEVRYMGIEEPVWQITANQAQLDPTSQAINMTGNVVARRAGNDLERVVNLLTDQLLFQPDQERIASESTVVFRVGDSQLTALGMQASLPDDTIQLETNVRGKYVP